MVLAGLCAVAIMFGLTPLEAAGGSGHGDMGAVGAEVANPLSNLWSLSMNFELLKFFDGDVFDKLLDWCDNDEGLWKRILVDNPAKLYNFNG